MRLIVRSSPARLLQSLTSRPTLSSARPGLNCCRFSAQPYHRSQPAINHCDLDMAGEEKDLAIRGKKSSKASVTSKVPKGTRDWVGADADLREEVVSSISNVLRKHGGTTLETPMFELREILLNKLGEDQKLIYDLADQGGEILSLRYDLSVAFARYLATNTNVQNIKRISVGNVFRRDQPAIQKGRFREFRQLDFDIAGAYDPMIPDAENVSIIVEAFDSLGLRDEITVRINHRKILDGMFRALGVPAESCRTISSAVDKLDKAPWEEVKKEMVEQKGLDAAVADSIGTYVQKKGKLSDVIQQLRADEKMTSSPDVEAGIKDMELLATYATALGAEDRVLFDMSLARGLDYYTGLIYECVTNIPSDSASKDAPESQVGSIAAGGRYDNLVGSLGRTQVPCVGVSFGVDRIFTILKAKREKSQKDGQSRAPRELDVFVMVFGGKDGLLAERMACASELRKAGLRVDYQPKVKPRFDKQFKAAEEARAPVAIIFGEDEVKQGKVKVKVLGVAEGPEKDGRLVDRGEMVAETKRALTTALSGSDESNF